MKESTARNFALLGAWLFMLLGACVIYACGAEEDSAESEEHWHDRYVRDHCERCPECCTVSLWAAADEVDDGDEGHDSAAASPAGPSRVSLGGSFRWGPCSGS